MIQSMEILQLPVMALSEKIEQALNENPVLEMQEPDAETDSPELVEGGPPEHESPDAPTEGEKELVVDEQKNNIDDFERLVELDREVPEFFDEGPRRSANRLDEEADRKHDAIANIESRPPSLQDHLMDQIRELELEPEVEQIAERIVSCLDPRDGGYFRTSLEDLLPADASSEILDLAREALETVQSLDPPGVAARDLRECLLRQLIPDMPYCEEQKTLIQDRLLDRHDTRRLERIAEAESETGIDVCRQLRPRGDA
jgi:RNA polymerase sigma-54 factor